MQMAAPVEPTETALFDANRLTIRSRFAGTRGLAINGGALIVNVLASGVTGLVFWIVAAHAASPADVAHASTAIAAIVAVVSLTQQGLVFTLPTLLAASPEPRRLAGRAYWLAIGLTMVAAPVYVVIGPVVAEGLGFLRSWRVGSLFVVGALIWCLFSLQDAVLTGVRKGSVVLAENTSWGLLRLTLVLGGSAAGYELGVGWLLASWIVPAGLLVSGISWYLFGSRRSPIAHPLGSHSFERRQFLSFLGAEYAAGVLSSAMALVIGAYALTTLGASRAAPFITAASLVVLAEAALGSFAQALGVEARRGTGDREHARNLLRLAGLSLGALSAAAVAITALAGHQIMALLGEHYRGAGGTALAIMMLGVPARSICHVSNVDNRIRGLGGRNLLQQAIACAVLFTALFSGRIDSVVGLSWAVVAMRIAPTFLAVRHLRVGGLRLPEDSAVNPAA